MGYYVRTIASDFFLDKKYFDDVYKKMCELNDYHDLKRGGSYGSNQDVDTTERYPKNRWFSWMDYNYPETCSNLFEILTALGFDWTLDDDGNITDLVYDCNKTGNEDYFLACFAGYVKDLSYITFAGEEENDYYRFVYINGKMIREFGVVNVVYELGEEYKFGEMSEADKATAEFVKNWAMKNQVS